MSSFLELERLLNLRDLLNEQLGITEKQIRDEFSRIRGIEIDNATLSPREREILSMLHLRLTNKEIASKLNIGERTVKFHVSALLHKFGKKTRHEL